MRQSGDIDIDTGDRNLLLCHLEHTPAAMLNDDGTFSKHRTGIYATVIPTNPLTGTAGFDYKEAEERGYFKIDVLNVSVYQQVTSYEHRAKLLEQEPEWDRLYDRDFCSKLIHIGNHYDTLRKMPEPVDSVARMAMFLAIIRPGKKHLVGLPWKEVAKTIWDPSDDGYVFRKSHSVGYSLLVKLHMNLLSSHSS